MSVLATLLALSPLAAPQSSQLVDVLIREGDPLPQQTDEWRIVSLGRPRGGPSGGWIVSVSAELDMSPFPPATKRALIGQRPSSPSGTVELIREPGTILGVVQGPLVSPSMANGSVAYISQTGISSPDPRVWVDDQSIAVIDDPVAGSAGLTWFVFSQVVLTTSGDALVLGLATDPVAGPRGIIWRWPSGDVLFDANDPLPGFSNPVAQILSELNVSPNGAHWSVLAVEEQTGKGAQVVDGRILDLGGGLLAMRGEPVPAAISGTSTAGNWFNFEGGAATVNNAGDYVFSGYIDAGSASLAPVIVSNGRLVGDGPLDNYPIGIDARGAVLVLQRAPTFALTLEGAAVLEGPLGVDLDGDGAPDPGFGVSRPTRNQIVRPNQRGETIFNTLISPVGSGLISAIVTGRPMRVDLPTCDGESNSTGLAANLVAVGSSELDDNEVSLRLFGLPQSASGYVLVSRLDGFVAQAGGSQGNLCLGGVIGRMYDQVFTAAIEGRVQVNLDLTMIPQPTGSVPAMAGIRWFAQAWYRDAVSGVATSNFSSASVLTFQ